MLYLHIYSIYSTVTSVIGHTFNISVVNREHMGEYTCVADNGVPPRALKRVKLEVKCKYSDICTYTFMCVFVNLFVYLFYQEKIVFQFLLSFEYVIK